MDPKDEVTQEETAEHAEADLGAPPEPELESATGSGEGVSAASGAAIEEEPHAAVKRLTEQLDDANDRHLRLAAEYDNFRRRTAKERQDVRDRSRAEVIASLLDAFDDLARVAHVDAEQSSVQDVLAGVQLVERKILRELDAAGIERISGDGEAFDPNHHEAVGMVPTTDPELDHTVADVFQVGYRIGGILLRPARVRVHTLQDDAAESHGAE